jgi:hypothetical protein
MAYYVGATFASGPALLVDRKKTKTVWWTNDVNFALEFREEKDAVARLSTLSYGNPEVVDAKNVHNFLDHDDTHPFSDDAF